MPTSTGKNTVQGVLPTPGELSSLAGESTKNRNQGKYGIMPSPAELQKKLALGMTQQQIADEVFERTGYRVTRNAVTMALRRAGIHGEVRRYDRQIPWRVRQVHERAYPLAMLRLVGRRERGLPMREEAVKRLDSWLAMMEEKQLVVVYWPDTEDGFLYRHRRPSDKTVWRGPDDDEEYANRGGEIPAQKPRRRKK